MVHTGNDGKVLVGRLNLRKLFLMKANRNGYSWMSLRIKSEGAMGM